jgi:hypothetical protein
MQGRVLAGKSQRKGPLGRLVHIWEGNINKNLREIWSEVGDYVPGIQNKELK